MVSTEFKGVGLHYTAFRDAIREDSRQTIPSRDVTPRRKFAVEANVESRVNRAWELAILAAFRKWLGGNRAKGLLPEPLAIIG